MGLAPAITTLRRDLRPSGEEGGRSVSGGASSRRIRRALVVAEFALAIVLLVGAGLLVRSWWYVSSIDPGFMPERVLVMELSSPATFNVPRNGADLYDRVLEQIQAVPGVESAGIIGDLFIDNPREQVLTVERRRRDDFRAPAPRDETRSARISSKPSERRCCGGASSRATIGPTLRGSRSSTMRWPGARGPARDPVGRRFKLGPRDSDGPWYTVVGVVGDMRRQGLEREPLPQIFESLAQNLSAHRGPPHPNRRRTTRLAMAGALRAAVRRVEKNAPIYGVAPLEQQLGTYLTQRRFQTSLLAAFSIVALLMAAVGIYGLIQYSIATRTQEIGLRMAIGAQAGDIFRMIIGEGLTLSLTGLALGLVGAWWLARAVSSLLFGVTASDPLTFATVSLVLTAVATAACYFPARRAMTSRPDSGTPSDLSGDGAAALVAVAEQPFLSPAFAETSRSNE